MWLLAIAFVLTAAPPTPGDLLVLAQVLLDRSAGDEARQQAASSLGCAGGDQAVRHLQAALHDATPTTRASIARALGNTRSRLAVPVLIDMFRDDPARDEVCNALVTLTHRTWCDGADDDVALRRAWRRWWSQMKGRVEIFAPESGCSSGESRGDTASLGWIRTSFKAASDSGEAPPSENWQCNIGL